MFKTVLGRPKIQQKPWFMEHHQQHRHQTCDNQGNRDSTYSVCREEELETLGWIYPTSVLLPFQAHPLHLDVKEGN